MTLITIDKTHFADAAITAETRAMVEEVEALLKTLPSIMEVGPEVVRAARAKGEGLLGKQKESDIAQWRTASALGREVPMRCFHPGGELKGVYLHIHGGGHTIGTADSQDQTLERMARNLGIGVASVEYRLAPENVWPAPADDCEAAALWLASGGAAEIFGTDKMTIGGESAGGHLSAVTILRLRDRHGLMPFKAANLVYGIYDMSLTPSMKRWGERNLIISSPIVDWFGEQLMPKAQFEKMDKRDPDMSPLYAALEGLCPALFTIGTLDPLLDDSLFMSARWLAAGNEAELAVYPGGIHAFDMLPGLTIAAEAVDRMNGFIARHLG